MKKIILLLWMMAHLGIQVSAQSSGSPMQKINLDDLSAFGKQDGNWRIVGNVTMDPTVDIHHNVTVTVQPVVSKKGKKSVSSPPVITPVQPVTFMEGKGILLNLNDDKKKSNLFTTFEHGDMELELELMVPRGSNSGLYLQGRYEVQILDSWGVKNPLSSDIGGIYKNWEQEPEKAFPGKAPLSNPSKAPGLWQKMKIVFQAPRFDETGKKIANARFLSVDLNGIRIHENIELPFTTGGPIQKNEVATAPFVIQGDHGPVAFRNIRYRMMREIKPKISAITYKVFHGHFKTISEFATLKPFLAGSNPELTCEVLDVDNGYASIYNGNITLPEDGKYDFGLAFTGGARLLVNGVQVIDHQGTDHWPKDIGSVELKAGTYPFEIYNYKDAGWLPPRLAFYVRAEGGKEIALHAYNSYPPEENPVSSILVNPGSSPKLLRAFVDFNGERSNRLTHTIGVGEPSGINYVYDLKSGNLSCVWRGDFVDATPMWHDRGDGSFRPAGSAQFTFLGQPLAFLENKEQAFPVKASESEYIGKGYEIDVPSGRPIFKYTYTGLEVSTRVFPDDSGKILTHEIMLKDRGSKPGLYYKLGEGLSIDEMPDGSFALNDKQYYIKVLQGTKPIVRTTNGKQELLVPFDSSLLSYSIIW